MGFDKSITVSSRGRREVRTLVERGEYVIVEYRDPGSLKRIERKFKIYLRRSDGSIIGYLMVPLKQEGRFLAFEDRGKEGKLYVYNPTLDREEEIFPNS